MVGKPSHRNKVSFIKEEILAYIRAHFVPIVHPFICKKFALLNTKLLNVNINFRKLMIAFVGRFFRFSVVSTALIPSLLEMFVLSERTFMSLKAFLWYFVNCGYFFLVKSVESLT